MEYFDFEGASSVQSNNHSDDFASMDHEFEAEERAANLHLMLEEGPLEFPNDPPAPATTELLMGDTSTEAYPMLRAEEPCDLCQRLGLDCVIPKRGVMHSNGGCTCCISLWRECSFTHAKARGKFLHTLHPVSENAFISTGGLTGKKVLKSAITHGDDSDSRSRRFSRAAANILKAWLREHNDNPYPTESEKYELQNTTGLSKIQISNWLANARRRGKVRPAIGADLPVPGTEAYSPPENEPAAMTDINRALANPPFDPSRPRRQPSGHVRHRHPGSSTNDSSHASSEHRRRPSVSSWDTSHSSISDLSFASAFSHRSSIGSMDRKERRRRRKVSVPVDTLSRQKARASRPFQCTFCTDSFAAKYDWQRHEKSMHLTLERWTCCPHGGVTEDQGILRCVFCSVINPDRDHLETHNYIDCQEKSIQERTFFRKDNLNQHLRLMHGAKLQPCMEKWHSSTTDIKSRCGLCGSMLSTWKDRVDHLAGHFKNGATMAQWQGDWGFEPHVLAHVENAMPPYLIDYDSKTPNPWTTAQAQGDDVSPRLNVPNDANCHARLSRELGAYIQNQKAQGVIPTDHMIQFEARRVIFEGDDDPWNQTCADNAMWLSILKRDNGLETTINDDKIQYDDLGLQPPFVMCGLPKNKSRATNPPSKVYPSPAMSSPGFQSPAYPTPGFSSTTLSGLNSLSGSYAASSGIISAGVPAFDSDWGSSVHGNASAYSTPVTGAPDPLVQMGFDPDFLQRLNDSYSELTPPEIPDLPIGAGHEIHTEKQTWLDTGFQQQTAPIPDPNAFFHSNEDGPFVSDAAQQVIPAFLQHST
ncbi:hypothetical protein N7495_002065 [Penicillium taxi]|uniref:uncharacterized protein n=1 Tax=Penicillium taxi TaxID=168475 RepID=UPI002544E00F|nr:uncharacterized protein N7495_002065 [Penicillium taxi]KAJ5901537.1 hypothetical protein N7495_002065 [Penicillium taxi]